MNTARAPSLPTPRSAPSARTTTLGTASGSRQQVNARAWESVRACDEMRPFITGVDHVPTESVPTCPSSCTTCASMETSWIMTCWLPLMGNSVSTSLCGDLPDHCHHRSLLWWSRRSHGHWRALPAFLASRIMCRRLVTPVTDHPSAALNQRILTECDTRTDEALSRLVSTLTTAAALDEALSDRELLLRNVLTGTEDAMRDLPAPSLRHSPPMAVTLTTGGPSRASA